MELPPVLKTSYFSSVFWNRIFHEINHPSIWVPPFMEIPIIILYIYLYYILYIIYVYIIYYMFTRGYGGFLSHGATPSSQNQLLFIRFLKSDFPWNQPSKYLGTPIYGNPHNYIIYIFILYIIYIIYVYYMFTRGYGGFLSHGATPSSQNQLLFIRFLKSDFPWNQPSKYLGTPIYGNPHNYIIYIFILYIIYYICIYYILYVYQRVWWFPKSWSYPQFSKPVTFHPFSEIGFSMKSTIQVFGYPHLWKSP